MFDDPNAMVRVDMSEYMDASAAARLIQGSSSGEGELTRRVRQQPFCALLLDEIEKAHPDVFNILLQVLDEGRLTDSHGRTVDFKNTVIILTSNLGSHFILEDENARAGKDGLTSTTRDKVMGTVQKAFRPEFLNRLDDIILFEPLGRSAIAEIVKMQLTILEKRLVERKIKLQIDDKGLAFVAAEAYHPSYGARPLKRYLEKNVTTALSKSLLTEELQSESIVTLSSDGSKIKFVSSPWPASTVEDVE